MWLLVVGILSVRPRMLVHDVIVSVSPVSCCQSCSRMCRPRPFLSQHPKRISISITLHLTQSMASKKHLCNSQPSHNLKCNKDKEAKLGQYFKPAFSAHDCTRLRLNIFKMLFAFLPHYTKPLDGSLSLQPQFILTLPYGLTAPWHPVTRQTRIGEAPLFPRLHNWISLPAHGDI